MKNTIRLKELRESRGFTQQYVADYVDLSQAQYNKYENCKSILKVNQLVKLCDLYNVSPNELLGWNKK